MMTGLFIAGLVLTLLAQAFISGTLAALASISPVRLQEEAGKGNRAAMRVQLLQRQPERLRAAAAIASTALLVLLAALAARLCLAVGVTAPEIVLAVQVLLLAPLFSVFGFVLPEAVARRNADRLAPPLGRAFWRVQEWLAPLLWLYGRLNALAARMAGRGRPEASREDLFAVAELAVEQGVVSSSTGRMLEALFEINSRPVASVMVPLADVRCLPEDATVAAVQKLAAASGFSRFPVYRDRFENIIGIVELRRLFQAGLPPAEGIRNHLAADLLIVPENRSAGSLLNELRLRKLPMAFVIDEFGSALGMVTVSDLVEVIIGDVRDERVGGEVFEIAPGRFECSGRLGVRDFGRRLGLDLRHEGVETVGGLMMKLAGRIPRQGDKMVLGKHQVTVLEMEGRRVTWIGVMPVPVKSGPKPADSGQGN